MSCPQPQPTFALFSVVTQCLWTRLPWWNSSQLVLKVYFIITWSQLSRQGPSLAEESLGWIPMEVLAVAEVDQ